MITETEKEAISNYSLTETPWYFGAYLNMARHNIFLLINHLTERFSYLGFEPIKDDEDIYKEEKGKNIKNRHILANIFDSNQKKSEEEQKDFEDEQFKVYRYLLKRHYLPCIRIFHEKKGRELEKNPKVDYAKLHNFLKLSFQAITDFRDNYSHYLAIDKNGDRVMERKKTLAPELKEAIEELFKLSADYSLKRFKETQKEEDYEHIGGYKLFEGDGHELTEKGFYFFVNLFLERSYAAKFLKKISGFKDERTAAFRATLQVFTTYSLKVPDVRLGSEDTKDALLMDMLNELQRCPKELYNHLSEDDKKKFEPSIGEKQKSNMASESMNYEKIREEEIDQFLAEISTLKRHNHRFPYFVLRYIDEYNLLPNIRFQITLGKLEFNNYPKKIVGVEINRRITKTIKFFGKLSDFENKEETVLKELKKENKFKENKKLKFEQYAPHYNLNNNKIPFYYFDTEERPAYLRGKPTGFISLNALPKLVLLAYYAPYAVENIIKNYLQSNKDYILNKEYLDGLKENLSFDPEQFTRRHIKEKKIAGKEGRTDFLNREEEKNLLSRLQKGVQLIDLSQDEYNKKFPKKQKKQREYADQLRYNALLSERRKILQKELEEKFSDYELPREVSDYLMNISDVANQKLIHQNIRAIRQDIKTRLRAIKKELEKDKEAQNIKLGELATFLSRDIIAMVVDKELKKRITSPYYNRLQNKIAYFSVSKQEIIEVCEELELFDKDKGHVFLSKDLIKKSKDILGFYQAYLEAKKDWIEEKLFRKGKTGGYILPETELIPYSFQKIKKAGSKGFEQWLVNKTKMPVDLPNCLFDKTLERQISNDKLHENKISFKENDKYSICLGKRLEGDIQAFYSWGRVYKHNKEEKQIDAAKMTAKEIKLVCGKHAERNEGIIRFIQTQDRILKLLCDKILSNDKTKRSQERIYLKDILPFSEHSPLNRAAVFEQTIEFKGGMIKVIAKDNEEQRREVEKYKELKTEEKEAYQGQKGYQWTVKDYGRFKRMVADRRIPELTAYFEKKEISFDFIIYQLGEYDKYREKIFERTFALEKYLTEKYFEEIKEIELSEDNKKEKENFNEIQFKVFTKWLEKNKDKHPLTDDVVDTL